MNNSRFFMQHIDDLLREMESSYSKLLNLQMNSLLDKEFDKDLLKVLDEYYSLTKSFRKLRSNVIKMYYDKEDQNIMRGENK